MFWQDRVPRDVPPEVPRNEQHTFIPPKVPVHAALGEQLLHRNVQRFRGGLVFKAHRRLYDSTLGVKGTKREKELWVCW